MEKEVWAATIYFTKLMVYLICIHTTPIRPLTAQNFTANVCLESTTCSECIVQNSNCAWCSEPDYNGTRCDRVTNLWNNSCQNVVNPEGELVIVQNDPLTDAVNSSDGIAVQVSPQVVNVTLKLGEPQSVRLNVRLANDYPLDLYYLTDLSRSLSDDLMNLRRLGRNLIRELKRLTSELQIGLGDFVDKVSSPFVVVDQDKCEVDACCSECAAPFSFRNELSLTNDTAQFTEKLTVLSSSTSIDSPEGGLDALVQVISCQDKIGWRNRARRMIVFATDAGFHIAGDGKLAGITIPNDGLCHIETGSNEYLRSTYSDYPSVGQINALLQEHNIIPVFVATEPVLSLYMELVSMIEGAYVGPLATDSSNVVRLVINTYKTITSKVEIVDTAPRNIAVSYTSRCFNEEPVPGSSRCSNVILGETHSLDVTVTATECPANREKQIFTVRPVGFDESLTIMAEVICDCDCEKSTFRDPSRCGNGNGTVTCGQCICDEGRYGQDCECDGEDDSVLDLSNCIAPNSTSVCQGRGSCVCGECLCQKPTNPKDLISGKYCECDNFSCARYQGIPCGGEKLGDCICGECQCNSDYRGDACDCLISTKACETPSGVMCNGFGECKCGKCICGPNSPFQGPTCEDCPSCNGLCSSFRECVHCKVFNKGFYDDEECDACSVSIQTVDVIDLNDTSTVLCQYLDDGNCTIIYTYDTMENNTYIVYVQESKVCRRTVERERQINIRFRWLMIGIIVTILLIGILLLALIKLAIFVHDRKEYAKFQKELESANWSASHNPIFHSSTSTFLNPMYGR